jgi:hypothetical protein
MKPVMTTFVGTCGGPVAACKMTGLCQSNWPARIARTGEANLVEVQALAQRRVTLVDIPRNER